MLVRSDGAKVLGLLYDCLHGVTERQLQALIVDDHELIRDALKGVLGSFAEITEISEAGTAFKAEKLLEDTPTISLVVLDLGLPDDDGLTLLRTIRAKYPSISVVVLSGTEERSNMTLALESGAAGFIPKSATRDVMQGALRLIMSGGIYVPPEILSRSTQKLAPPGVPRAVAKLGLTERQTDVLGLMMQGKSNKEICRALDIAEPTVKNHVTAILRELGASNRTEAVIAATDLATTGVPRTN